MTATRTPGSEQEAFTCVTISLGCHPDTATMFQMGDEVSTRQLPAERLRSLVVAHRLQST